MNCANHPDVERAAFCQNCGKPLCRECMKTVGSAVYCEPCLAAKLAGAGAGFAPGAPSSSGYHAAAGSVWSSGPRGSAGYDGTTGSVWSVPSSIPPPPMSGPNPVLAGMLGFIPGVGAMYNGQFVKAVVHIIVFAVLNGILVDSSWNAGFTTLWSLMLAGWVFYQVFDAYHTARARRDGEPLPDPFGLNTLGDRIGLGGAQKPAGQPYSGAYAATGAPAATGIPGFAPQPDPAGGTTQYAQVPPYPTQTYPGGGPTPPSPYEPNPYMPGAVPPAYSYNYTYSPPGGYGPVAYDPATATLPPRHPLPVGAIVLIGLGIFFLLGTMDVFNTRWLGRGGWPFLLIGLGVWIFISRLQGTGGLHGDGSATHRWHMLRALCFPVWAIILTGLLALLDSWHVLSWDVGWAFYLIVWGVLVLAMRTATAQMQQESFAAAQAQAAAAQQSAAAQPSPTSVGSQPEATVPAQDGGGSTFEGR